MGTDLFRFDSMKIIVCMDRGNGIGLNGELLYSIKEDMEHFVKTTRGAVVIMGSETYLSLKRPLKGRLNIVMSRGNNEALDGRIREDGRYLNGDTEVVVLDSVEDVTKYVDDLNRRDVYVIGGSNVYNQFIEIVDELIVTHVDDIVEADRYFPVIDVDKFYVDNEKQLTEKAVVKCYRRNIK